MRSPRQQCRRERTGENKEVQDGWKRRKLEEIRNKSLKQCLMPLILYIMLKQNLDTTTKLGIS